MPPYEGSDTNELSTLRTVISLFHFSESIRKSISMLMPCEYEKIGGAGNKFLMMLENTTDVYYYPTPGLSSWDVCAPEALVYAMKGIVTDLNRNPIIYTKRLKLLDGVISTRNF